MDLAPRKGFQITISIMSESAPFLDRDAKTSLDHHVIDKPYFMTFNCTTARTILLG